MNIKIFGMIFFVLYFSTCNFLNSMKNVIVFGNQNCCVKVSMLKWWKKFSLGHTWYAQEKEDIELLPIPDGFTVEYVDDLNNRYNGDKALCFRCNLCKTVIYYTQMYHVLKKREKSQKDNTPYTGCQNCYTDPYFYLEKNWNN